MQRHFLIALVYQVSYSNHAKLLTTFQKNEEQVVQSVSFFLGIFFYQKGISVKRLFVCE